MVCRNASKSKNQQRSAVLNLLQLLRLIRKNSQQSVFNNSRYSDEEIPEIGKEVRETLFKLVHYLIDSKHLTLQHIKLINQ